MPTLLQRQQNGDWVAAAQQTYWTLKQGRLERADMIAMIVKNILFIILYMYLFLQKFEINWNWKINDIHHRSHWSQSKAVSAGQLTLKL